MIGRTFVLLLLLTAPLMQHTHYDVHATKEHILDLKQSLLQKTLAIPYRAIRDNTSAPSCSSWAAELAGIEQALCNMQKAGACAPIPISSSTTITTPDTVYCLAQNVGFIIIDAHDVTLLMNGRSITEFLEITSNGERAIVSNGKIIADAPTTMLQAAAGAVHIAAGANNSVISFCMIQPMDTTVPDVNGMVGLNNAADNVAIMNCEIYGGGGGPASTLVPQAGNGIINTGTNTLISECLIMGGHGSASNDGAISSGHGGNGLTTSGSATTCQNLFVIGGNGGTLNVTTGNIADGITTITGNGGHSIVYDASFNPILRFSHLVGGAGGNATALAGSIATNGGSLTTGGSGSGVVITNFAAGVAVKNCFILSQASGSATSSNDIANNGNVTISSAGKGLFINGAGGVFLEDLIVGGLNAGNVETSTGTIGNNSGNVQIGNGGDGIYADSASALFIKDCLIIGNATGAITASSNAFAPGTTVIENVSVGNGGSGLIFTQQTALITAQAINTFTGNGNVISAATGSIAATVFAGSGGEGVHIAGTQTTVTDIMLSAQQGGTIFTNDPLASNFGVGGSGGNGVTVAGSASNTIVTEVSVLATGSGGSVATGSGASGTGGSGGVGILIEFNANNTKVNNCSITHTGTGGTGSVSGNSGEAIRDQGNGSAIFSNMAVYIAAVPEYILTIGSAIDATNGTNFFAVGNDHPLANIWK